MPSGSVIPVCVKFSSGMLLLLLICLPRSMLGRCCTVKVKVSSLLNPPGDAMAPDGSSRAYSSTRSLVRYREELCMVGVGAASRPKTVAA